jgi:hypothetical protein
VRDPSTKLPRNHLQYGDWVRFLTTVHAGGHSFNSEPRSSRQAADYTIKHFDETARMQLNVVRDFSSALKCNTALDKLVPRLQAWFREWVESAGIPRSKQPSRKAYEDLDKRLLRRAEYWKGKAHAICLSLTEESPKQRASRRQRVLKPLLKKAGITSDEVWAERAGENIDRNTPRDYRNGKTKRLRKANRHALAIALGIAESELPE